MVQEDEISIRPLSAALRKKAEEELNETPKKIVSHLKILRDWIQTQPDLQTMKTTNQWLIAFLRGCKHDVEKTKGKLKMYATFKATIPELYGNRDPFDPDIQEILKIGAFLPLRKTNNEDAPRICLSVTGPYSCTRRPMVDLLKVILMIVEILLIEDDHSAVVGLDSLSDIKGVRFGFLLQWTPSVARNMLTCVEKALSMRLKRIQIINAPYGVSFFVSILKMFLTAKIKNRILVQSKESLLNDIDKSLLPEEYGGTDGTLQELTDYWKEKIESYRDWFLDQKEDSS